MVKWKQALLGRYQAPSTKDGDDLGGDRGDAVLTPDEDDVDPENPDKGEKDLKDPFAKEDEKEETADDKTDEKADEKDKAKGKAIPLDRHKQILEREREARAELERKLSQYQQGQKVADINEDLTKMEDKVLAMEKQYNKLLADGEIERASELMGKIRVARGRE